MPGLEAAPLGVGESLVGKLKRRQVDEGLADAFEPLLEVGCQQPERRSGLGIRSDYGYWIGQQRGALRIGGGGTPGRDDREYLALPQ